MPVPSSEQTTVTTTVLVTSLDDASPGDTLDVFSEENMMQVVICTPVGIYSQE